MGSVCKFVLLWPWLTEVGLRFDLVGFAILSVDVWGALRSEKEAYAEVSHVRRQAFGARYGVFAPGEPVMVEEQRVFDAGEAARDASAERQHRWRKRRVILGIVLVLVGFGFQFLGALPCSPPAL